MNRTCDEIRLHLLLRQPFTRAEQDCGSEPSVIRAHERAHTLFGFLTHRVDQMAERPAASVFDLRNAFRHGASDAHQPPVGSCVGGKIELARIQWRRDTCELAEYPEMVALVNAQHVPFHGELTGAACGFPNLRIAN